MNIKRMRERAGVKQEDLAKALDVTQTAVSKWEAGTSKPTASKLPQIAEVLHCTIDDLY